MAWFYILFFVLLNVIVTSTVAAPHTGTSCSVIIRDNGPLLSSPLIAVGHRRENSQREIKVDLREIRVSWLATTDEWTQSVIVLVSSFSVLLLFFFLHHCAPMTHHGRASSAVPGDGSVSVRNDISRTKLQTNLSVERRDRHHHQFFTCLVGNLKDEHWCYTWPYGVSSELLGWPPR